MFAERELEIEEMPKVSGAEVNVPNIEEFPDFTKNDEIIREKKPEPMYNPLPYGVQQYGVIQAQAQEKPKYAAAAGGVNPPGPDLELADRVVFFVPGEEHGLEIYDQSPTGLEAAFAGSLPDGKFYASGMEVVEFDPNEHGEEFRVVNTRGGSYVQRVVMVDEETFLRIAMQGIFQQHPDNPLKSHYFVIDMHDTTRPLRREVCDALCMDDQLESKQKAILDAAIDSAEHAIKDVVLGKGKGQK